MFITLCMNFSRISQSVFCPDFFIYFDHDFHVPQVLTGFRHLLPTKLYALSLSTNTQKIKVKKNQLIKCVMYNIPLISG